MLGFCIQRSQSRGSVISSALWMAELKHEEMKWICLLDDYSLAPFASHLTAHVLGQNPIYYMTSSPDRGKAKGTRNPVILNLISSFLFPRMLACTKGQRNIPVFVKRVSDSPGVCSPSGTFWMCWTMTPPKYWPNSVPRPWLGGKDMNTLFDNCHHWKLASVIVSWNKRACKSHLVTQALSYQLLGAAFKSLLRKMAFSTSQPRLP